MSEHSQRMKWWEKFHNKEICQDLDRNDAALRDLLRASLLRMLHAKIDEMNVETIISNIEQKIRDNYTDLEIADYILRQIPELNKQEEDSND